MQRYRIPKDRARVEIRVSNSRFIATAAPAATVADAQAVLREVRTEMPDATHHVYAFKVGYGATVSEGLSDDGEPSGTSGPPVMAVLRGAGIGDTIIVVTRYFGGTKLGTGGLVSAYTDAAKAVISALETEEKVERETVRITLPYALLEPIRRALGQFEAGIVSEAFGADVTLEVRLPVEQRGGLDAYLQNISSGRVAAERIED